LLIPNPFITQDQNPDPDESNIYFDFSLTFLAQKHCISTHYFPLKWIERVNSNYLVRIQIPLSRKVWNPDLSEYNDHFNFS